ncbi:putative lipoprotein [Leptospira wolffii serovar Khorat str. Khorat-H2]|nr:putative lipoprotein [Leptospira wolffii serovar Khorat str. Khorat-H2]
MVSAHRIVFFILLLTALQSCAAPQAFLESNKNEMPQP